MIGSRTYVGTADAVRVAQRQVVGDARPRLPPPRGRATARPRNRNPPERTRRVYFPAATLARHPAWACARGRLLEWRSASLPSVTRRSWRSIVRWVATTDVSPSSPGAREGSASPPPSRFAEEGASVAVLDLDAGRRRGRDRCRPRRPSTAIGLACDVSDAASVEAAVARVVDELGGLAHPGQQRRRHPRQPAVQDDRRRLGPGDGRAPAGRLPDEPRAAQKHFVEQKYGKILNLSSVSALGNRGQANYSAAKMGIQGFTRTLGHRARPVRRQRQRDRPRLHRHRHDRRHRRAGVGHGAVEELPQGRRRRATRCAGSATPRTSPPPRRSCAATRRRTSPARRCTSTAAPRSERATRRRVRAVIAARPPAEPHWSHMIGHLPQIDP